MSPALAPRPRTLEFIEIVTVGLPFCAFKLIAGDYLATSDHFALAGWILIALGIADAVFNVVNALTVAIVARRVVPVCSLQALSLLVRRTPRAGDVGSALDTVVAFSLVAAMIAASALAELKPALLSAWNIAVILNVIGAGALRLFHALAPTEPR